MKPSLLIMAAGMGSRYGGLKQMEPMGPNGSALLDYSVYDAIRAGFGKVVFVIRHDIEADFKKIVGKKWEPKIPVRYVFQELAMVPEGFQVPEGRQKPWGTGHAVWVAQGAIQEPFAAINADDYYGRNSFKVLAGFLKKVKKADSSTYSMVGFPLDKTLSEHGTVARGVCRLARGRRLREVVERTQIGQEGRKVFYLDESGTKHPLKRSEMVSMNMWGFTPRLFRQLDQRFGEFLEEKGRDIKSEFLIPRVVDDAISTREATVKVLSTKDRWFGVTYPQDREIVRQNVLNLVKRKVYPDLLWK
jgi:NDP-sugar pyrophosphorylase family protein